MVTIVPQKVEYVNDGQTKGFAGDVGLRTYLGILNYVGLFLPEIVYDFSREKLACFFEDPW